MNRSSRIYVAGHKGLVGSAILRELQQNDFSQLVTRTSTELDLRDQSAVNRFFSEEKPEYVFLAAARVGGIHANNSFPADFIRDNLQIQTNVIDAAYRNECSKLQFLGSSCIYPRMAEQPLKEEYLLTGELEPTNEWYAIAKIAGIKMCQAYRRQYGFNAISVMPTNLYGPGDNYDLETSHVLPALIRKFHLAKLAVNQDLDGVSRDERHYGRIPDDIVDMLSLRRLANGFDRAGGEPRVMLWGSGSPLREFLYIHDLARATLFLMENYDDEGLINVGVGGDIPIRDLARMVQEIVGFDGDTVWDDSKPDGTPRKLMDVSRLSALGWHADYSLETGIAETYQEYCRQSS